MCSNLWLYVYESRSGDVMTHPLIQMAESMTVKLVYLWTSFTYVFPTLADNTFEQCEQRLKLNKLTDAVMTKFESSYPSHTLRPDLRNQIEECICKKLPDLHTPDHPTYALVLFSFSLIVLLHQFSDDF